MPRNTASTLAMMEKGPIARLDWDSVAELDRSAGLVISSNGPFSVYPRPAVAAPDGPEDTAVEVEDEPAQTEIAEVAYQLWLDRNCGHGGDVEDWYLALDLIRRRRMK